MSGIAIGLEFFTSAEYLELRRHFTLLLVFLRAFESSRFPVREAHPLENTAPQFLTLLDAA